MIAARRSDVTGVVDREKRLHRKLDDARVSAEAGRWSEAIEMLQVLAGANPTRADITQQLKEVTQNFERSIHEHNFTKDDVPVVTIGADALALLSLNPAEGF